MATGYQRQDTTGNIANNNVVDADDLNNEFDAIANAMNASTGHNHDGTIGGGASINRIGPAQDFRVEGDKAYPKYHNTMDFGTSAIQWKNAWFDGTVSTDLLEVDETSTFTGEATFNGGIVGNVTGDLTGNIRAADGTLVFNNGSDGTDATFTGSITGAVTGDIKNSDSSIILDVGSDTVTAVLTGDVVGDVYASNGTSKILEAGTDGTDATFTGNADTASQWATTRTVTFATGDVTGSFSIDGSGDVSDVNLTIENDSVALGTQTTGNYVESVSQSTGVTITDSTVSGDNAVLSVSIGQDVATTADVEFNTIDANKHYGDVYLKIPAQGGGFTEHKIVNVGTNGSNAIFTGNVSGNAGTATALETARNIGGVSFDGTSDINLPGVNTAGTQDTSGNAATADTADRLANARTIALTGVISGSATFDGSGNISITTTGGGGTYTGGDGISISGTDVISVDSDQRGHISQMGYSTSDYMISESSSFTWYINGGSRLSLSSSGNLTATGDVTAYSDERLKDNIRTVDNALNMVEDMRGVFYDKDGKAGVGVIAQEIQKVLPEVVNEEGDYLSVAYGNVVGVLIEAIKELKAEIEELKNDITK